MKAHARLQVRKRWRPWISGHNGHLPPRKQLLRRRRHQQWAPQRRRAPRQQRAPQRRRAPQRQPLAAAVIQVSREATGAGGGGASSEGVLLARAVVSTVRSVPTGAGLSTWAAGVGVQRALNLDLFLAGLKLLPLGDELSEFLSLGLDLGDVVSPLDLGVLAAGFVDLALDELVPDLLDGRLSLGDRALDALLEIFEDSLPGGFHASFQVDHDSFTAGSSFVTSLEEITVLCFGLSKSSFVDLVTVGLDERSSDVAVPGFDFGLDFIETLKGVFLEGDGLSHVTFGLSLSALLDGLGSANQSADDDRLVFHKT